MYGETDGTVKGSEIMDLKTRLEILPCGKCEDMMDCDLCIFQKEAKELYNEIYNQALEDVLKLIATLGIDWGVKNSDIDCLRREYGK